MKIQTTAPMMMGLSQVSHDAKKWKTTYSKASPAQQKKMRAAIFSQTEKASTKGFKVNGKKITLDAKTTQKMQKGTKLVVKPSVIKAGKKKYTTTVKVYNGDTLNITRQLQNKGLNPCALNMANENHPGGGVKNGAQAQEESICRVTNYSKALFLKANPTLKKQMKGGKYHIPTAGTIYTPSVQVFRKTQKDGYTFTKPYTVDLVASAAIDFNKKTAPTGKKYEQITMSKMRAILRTSKYAGHDSVVLGAFGCGAFKNDPKVITRLYKQVLKEKEFKNAFKEVAFAVIDDKNGNNYKPFKKELDGIKL